MKTTNEGVHDALLIGTGFTTLLRFSGLSQIPASATVLNAALGLWHFIDASPSNQTVGCYLVRPARTWVEGTKYDQQASLGESTWLQWRYGQSNWGVAGAKSRTTDTFALTNYAVIDRSVVNDWHQWLVTNDVQSIVSGNAVNNGWGLYGSDTDFAGFYSATNGTGNAPFLTVTYTEGGTTPTPAPLFFGAGF